MAEALPAVRVEPPAGPRADTRADVLIELQARQLHADLQAALDGGDLEALADLYKGVAGLVLLGGSEGRAARAFRQAAARAARKRAGRRRRPMRAP